MFSDLELARRLESAEAHAGAKFVEARAKVFPQILSQWIKVAGVSAMYDGVASPATQTFGLGLFQPVTNQEMDTLERFFQNRSAPVLHEVSPLAGIPVMNSLIERGYRPVELTSVMYRDVPGNNESSPSRHERIRARPIDKDEHDVWAKTMADGWGDIADLSGIFKELAKTRAVTEDAISFIAELDGSPIAAGGLNIGAGVALMAGACTVPEFRNKGAQLALLDCRLRYAASYGCDLAMMCAEPGSRSQRNAERNGFRIGYTRIKWRLA